MEADRLTGQHNADPTTNEKVDVVNYYTVILDYTDVIKMSQYVTGKQTLVSPCLCSDRSHAPSPWVGVGCQKSVSRS